MSYRIVGDSCSDFTEQELAMEQYRQVPLMLYADGRTFVDDETFDQKDFLDAVLHSREVPRSACPAPEAFMTAFEGADDVYVVTLSSELSGSYNSAALAKRLYHEQGGSANVHVFNSRSAAAGQHLLVRTINRYASSGMPFEEVVERIEAMIARMETLFVLETLDVLQKNGRLSRVAAIVANTLNIKPVMAADNGTIVKAAQARGMNKALNKMVEEIKKRAVHPEEKILSMTQCNCPKRAAELRDAIGAAVHFKEIQILEARGVSSLYACDGGIVISF